MRPTCPWLCETINWRLLLAVGTEQLGAPFLRRGVQHFPGRLGDRREVFHPFVGAGRVDDRPGVETFFGRMNNWIERTAPAAP